MQVLCYASDAIHPLPVAHRLPLRFARKLLLYSPDFFFGFLFFTNNWLLGFHSLQSENETAVNRFDFDLCHFMQRKVIALSKCLRNLHFKVVKILAAFLKWSVGCVKKKTAGLKYFWLSTHSSQATKPCTFNEVSSNGSSYFKPLIWQLVTGEDKDNFYNMCVAEKPVSPVTLWVFVCGCCADEWGCVSATVQEKKKKKSSLGACGTSVIIE